MLHKQKTRQWIANECYPPMWRRVGFVVGAMVITIVALAAIGARHNGQQLTWPPAFSADPHGPPPPMPPH